MKWHATSTRAAMIPGRCEYCGGPGPLRWVIPRTLGGPPDIKALHVCEVCRASLLGKPNDKD